MPVLESRAPCCANIPYLDDIENDEEELMLCSKNMRHPAAAPGDDVWMKLGFPPTPPRSPTKSLGEVTTNSVTVIERLQLVSESLDDYLEESRLDSFNLRSKLIQDCMWNGLKSDDGLGPHSEAIYETPCSTPPPLDYSSTDCVDPTTVFPYPLNENGQSQQEDTDEEIDVVSLDKPELKRKPLEPIFGEPKNSKLFKRTRSLPIKSGSRGSKRTFDDSSSDTSMRNSNDNRNTDDSDTDKRASHNVLERKRRNDLKSSFHTLRSYVPNLCSVEKAAKVVILKKATDYIHELQKAEDNLAKEKDDLKTRQRELLERFIKLKPKVK